MEFIGTIRKIYPLTEGTSKSTGNVWKCMEFVVETEDKYPQTACFQLMNDNCTRFEIKEGEKVNVQFDIRCREWEGKSYNTLTAWKITKIQ